MIMSKMRAGKTNSTDLGRCNTWFLEPTWISPWNSILWVHLFFAQLIHVTSKLTVWHTDRQITLLTQ